MSPKFVLNQKREKFKIWLKLQGDSRAPLILKVSFPNMYDTFMAIALLQLLIDGFLSKTAKT